WQQVAAVPPGRRAEYVEETRAAGGEVSTAGLLRHTAVAAARAPGRRHSIDHVGIGAEARQQALKRYRELLSLPSFRPESLVSALDSPQKRHLLRTLDRLSDWLQAVRRELAVYRISGEEE